MTARDPIDPEVDPPTSIAWTTSDRPAKAAAGVNLLDRITAVYFGIPREYLPHLDRTDFARHRAVVIFTGCIVLPLSAIAFAHLAVLVGGADGFAALTPGESRWALSAIGIVFGTVLCWLNNSGTTIVLRSRAASWKKLLGTGVRVLFIALNVALFTGAIVTFSFRSQLASEREAEVRRKTEAAQNAVTQAHSSANSALANIDEQLRRISLEGKADGPVADSIQPALQTCRVESARQRAQLDDVDVSISAAAAIARGLDEQAATRANERLRSLHKRRAELVRAKQQKDAECTRLTADLNEAITNHRSQIAKQKEQILIQKGNVQKAEEHRTSTATSNSATSIKEAVEANRQNLGAEVLAFHRLISSTSADHGGSGDYILWTAMVVAAFCALIELMPVILGWTLKDKEIDEYLDSQSRQSLARMRNQESLATEHEHAQLDAARAERAERARNEASVRAARIASDAQLESARHHADAVKRLDVLLSEEKARGASDDALVQVRDDTRAALRQVFSRRSRVP